MKTLIGILEDRSGSLKSQKSLVVAQFYNFMLEQKLFEKFDGSVTLLTFNHRAITIFRHGALHNEGIQPGRFDPIFEGVESKINTNDELSQILCFVITDSKEEMMSNEAILEMQELILEKLNENGNGFYWSVLYIGENENSSSCSWFNKTGLQIPATVDHPKTPISATATAIAISRRRRSSTSRSPRHLPYTRSMPRLRSIKRIYDSYFRGYSLIA